MSKILKIKDIYRNDCFTPQEIAFFEMIENALGFKLYFWQKTFLITGSFRQGGFTTAECLKKLFGGKPIDYSHRTKNAKEHSERMQLLELKRCLDHAGIKTVPVFTSEREKRNYDQAHKKLLMIDEIHTAHAYAKEDT